MTRAHIQNIIKQKPKRKQCLKNSQSNQDVYTQNPLTSVNYTHYPHTTNRKKLIILVHCVIGDPNCKILIQIFYVQQSNYVANN